MTAAQRTELGGALLMAPRTYLVSAPGGLDDGEGRTIEQEIERLASSGAREIVVDLADADALRASGIEPVIRAGRRRGDAVDLTIVVEDETLFRLLELVQAERYFTMTRTLTAAFARLAENRTRDGR